VPQRRGATRAAALDGACQGRERYGAASRGARCASGLAVSRAMLPPIATAELCSCYSVLTSPNVGHAIEASLWGLHATLLLLSLALAWPNAKRTQRPLPALFRSAAFIYAAFLFGVNVPTY
jgi:hypothetical protein